MVLDQTRRRGVPRPNPGSNARIRDYEATAGRCILND